MEMGNLTALCRNRNGQNLKSLGKRKGKEKARFLEGPGKCYLCGMLAPRRRVLCEARRYRQRTSPPREIGVRQVTETLGDSRNLSNSCWLSLLLQDGVVLRGDTACEITLYISKHPINIGK